VPERPSLSHFRFDLFAQERFLWPFFIGTSGRKLHIEQHRYRFVREDAETKGLGRVRLVYSCPTGCRDEQKIFCQQRPFAFGRGDPMTLLEMLVD